jgi:acetyl esterase/lipase
MSKYALVFTVVMLATTPVVRAQTPQTAPPQTPAQPSANSTEKSPVSVEHDIPYATVGKHPLLLDIYQPSDHSSELRPAVIVIHGGTWMTGDKENLRAMATFLARTNFVAFAVDYRLAHDRENHWPAQLDDVQRAVRWIRANAAKYGIDPERIGAFGHSAGAQLAALLGLEGTRDNSDPALAKYSSTVQAVVDVSGPTDFTTKRDSDDEAFLTWFLGGDYAHDGQIWRDASPAFHVSKKAAPFLIVHGTHDESVSMAQAQELVDKLKQAGVPVKFVQVDDAHTFETPEARKRLALETQAFFTQYLLPGNAK